MRWLFVLALPCLACGDSGADKGDLDDYCDSYCGWRKRCLDAQSPAECVRKCLERAEEANYTNYRAAAIQALASCFEKSEECGNDDQCASEAIRAVAPKLQEDERYKRCIEVRESCEESPFTDDHCASQLALTDAARSEFEACYDEPCDKMRDCVALVMGD